MKVVGLKLHGKFALGDIIYHIQAPWLIAHVEVPIDGRQCATVVEGVFVDRIGTLTWVDEKLWELK